MENLSFRTPRTSFSSKNMSPLFFGSSQMAYTFTNDPAKVDAASKVFEADGDLEEKIECGDAVWCYFRLYLWPWQRTPGNDVASARRRIMHLAPSLQMQTDKLMKMFMKNQGHATEEIAPCSKETVDVTTAEFKLLDQCHKEWNGQKFVKEWMISKATWIHTLGWCLAGNIDAVRYGCSQTRAHNPIWGFV
jgi:hypothetical protein